MRSSRPGRCPISDPARILIVRPSALGDVCRTVPVLASLRRAWPDAIIDWVVQDTFAPAIAAHPALNEAIAFPRKGFASWWRSPGATARLVRWLNALRARRYDLVVDCQGLGRSGLITRWTGANRRVGDRDARELAWLGYSAAHRLDRSSTPLHTVDRMLGLLEAEGIEIVHDMRLYVSDTDSAWWDAQRQVRNLEPGRYVVLAPTSRWMSKRWPIERWGQLIRPLLMRGFDHVVLIGGPNEREQVQTLQSGEDVPDSPVVNLVDQTSIGQTMAVIAQAGLVIANDSAPLHMAVGFNRPCVGLFGPTDPQLVGPYRQAHAVLRLFTPRPGEIVDYKDAKLGDRLMRVISTAAVVDQIDRVLTWHGQQTDSTPAAEPQPCRGDHR